MIKNNGKSEMPDLVNGMIGAMVGITAGCAVINAWSSIVVGVISGLLVNFATPLVSNVSNFLYFNGPIEQTTPTTTLFKKKLNGKLIEHFGELILNYYFLLSYVLFDL